MSNEFKIIVDTIGAGDLDKTLKQLEQYKQTVQLTNRETQKFNQQFSKENKGVQDQLKLVNLEISKMEQGSRKATKQQQQQLQALKVKQKELTKEVQLYAAAETAAKEVVKKKYNESNGLIDQQKAKLRELRQAAAQATSVTDLEKYNKAIAETGQELKRLQARTGDLRDQNNVLNNSYDELTRRNRQLSADMRKLPIDDVTGDLARMQREYNNNNDILKRFDAQLGRHTRNVGDYEGALNRVLASLKGVGGGLSSAIGSGGGGGLGIIGAGAAGAFPQLAAAGAALSALEGSSQVFADINKQLRDTQSITQLAGQSLTDLVGDIRATASTFSKDYNEVLETANILMERFGATGEEAVDLINEGFLRGADINGNYLDQISEYAGRFKDGELAARDLVAVAITAADKGFFSDKFPDTLAEGVISIREMTKATKDAINGIGLSADEIQKSIRSGEKDIREVLIDISKRLQTLKKDSPEVGAAIADIFRGAGEDAAFDAILAIQTLNNEFDEGFGPLNKYQQKQAELLESQQGLDTALVTLGQTFSGVSDSIDIFTNSTLTFLVELLTDLFELVQSNEEILGRFGDSVAKNDNIESLNQQLATLKQQLEDTEPSFLDYILSIGNVSQASVNATKEKARLRVEIQLLEERIKTLNSAVKEEKQDTEELNDAQKKQIAAYRRLVDGARDYGSALSVSEMAELAKAQDKIAEAALRTAQAFEKIEGEGLQSTFDAFLDKQPEIETFLGAYEAAFGESFLKPTETVEEAYGSFVDRIEKKLKKTVKDHKEAEKAKTEASRIAEEERQQIINTSVTAAQDIAYSVFDITSNLRDKQLQRLEGQMAYELSLVEGSEEAQIAVKEKFDRKRAQIQKKQAQAEKKLALFNIAINGAMAIAKVFATTGPPASFVLAALIGGITLAQGIAVATEPIPAFRRGTDKQGVRQDTFAYVGEAGQELVEYPTGQMALTPSKTTLTYLPKGSKVKTAEETRKVFYDMPFGEMDQMKSSPQMFKNSTHVPQFRTTSRTAKDLQQAIKLYAQSNDQAIQKAVEKGLSKLTLHQYIPSDRGTRHFIVKGGKRRESLNKRNGFLGRKG